MAYRSLQQLLDEFCHIICGCHHELRIVFHVGVPTKQARQPDKTPQYKLPSYLEKGPIMFTMDLKDNEDDVLHINQSKLKDAKGNPTTLDPGTINWFVDNTEMLALTPSDDGLSCTLHAVAPLGVVTLTVKAKSQGVDVAGSAEITIKSGAAVELDLTADAPTTQS